MCFIQNCAIVSERIADKDIPCYKILEYAFNKWMSPYRGYHYKFDVALPLISICDEYSTWEGKREVKINEGYHSYYDQEEALYSIAQWNRINDNNYGIFKSIIPKETRYFTDGMTNVSETIIIPFDSTLTLKQLQ